MHLKTRYRLTFAPPRISNLRTLSDEPEKPKQPAAPPVAKAPAPVASAPAPVKPPPAAAAPPPPKPQAAPAPAPKSPAQPAAQPPADGPKRAPAGYSQSAPLVIGGQSYVGGKFIPGDVVANATPTEKKQIAEQGQGNVFAHPPVNPEAAEHHDSWVKQSKMTGVDPEAVRRRAESGYNEIRAGDPQLTHDQALTSAYQSAHSNAFRDEDAKRTFEHEPMKQNPSYSWTHDDYANEDDNENPEELRALAKEHYPHLRSKGLTHDKSLQLAYAHGTEQQATRRDHTKSEQLAKIPDPTELATNLEELATDEERGDDDIPRYTEQQADVMAKTLAGAKASHVIDMMALFPDSERLQEVLLKSLTHRQGEVSPFDPMNPRQIMVEAFPGVGQDERTIQRMLKGLPHADTFAGRGIKFIQLPPQTNMKAFTDAMNQGPFQVLGDGTESDLPENVWNAAGSPLQIAYEHVPLAARSDFYDDAKNVIDPETVPQYKRISKDWHIKFDPQSGEYEWANRSQIPDLIGVKEEHLTQNFGGGRAYGEDAPERETKAEKREAKLQALKERKAEKRSEGLATHRTNTIEATTEAHKDRIQLERNQLADEWESTDQWDEIEGHINDVVGEDDPKKAMASADAAAHAAYAMLTQFKNAKPPADGDEDDRELFSAEQQEAIGAAKAAVEQTLKLKKKLQGIFKSTDADSVKTLSAGLFDELEHPRNNPEHPENKGKFAPKHGERAAAVMAKMEEARKHRREAHQSLKADADKSNQAANGEHAHIIDAYESMATNRYDEPKAPEGYPGKEPSQKDKQDYDRWEVNSEWFDKFEEIEDYIFSSYDPDSTARERFDLLMQASEAAKEGIEILDRLPPAPDDDEEKLTASDISENRKHLQRIIKHSRTARDHLREYVQHRKELRTIHRWGKEE